MVESRRMEGLTTLTAAGRQQATSAQEELVGQAWI